MWFKNLVVYQFQQKFSYASHELNAKLMDFAFTDCAKHAASSVGWVPIFENSEQYVFSSSHYHLIALQTEDKILPSSVIKDEWLARIKSIEEKESRKLFKKEKESLRDDVYFDLLPRAFTKKQKIMAYLDLKNHRLLIDAPTRSRAEYFLTLFRKALGDVKCELPKAEGLSALMTVWLKNNEEPTDFIIEDACVLLDERNERASIKVQCHDLFSDDIQQLLSDAHRVSQLACCWKEQIRFVLKEDFSINRLKFLEAVLSQSEDVVLETKEEQMACDFTIMTETLDLFLMDCFAFLGQETAKIEKVEQEAVA